MTKKPKAGKPMTVAHYSGLLSSVSELLEQARRTSARTINTILTATYWEVGRRIVEIEQAGRDRARYGERLLRQLSHDLKARFSRGFSADNLESMRLFYLSYPEKSKTVSRISGTSRILGEMID